MARTLILKRAGQVEVVKKLHGLSWVMSVRMNKFQLQFPC